MTTTQDTNEVVLSVLRQQRSQLIYVGDTHQQIYEWRGAVNAMDHIATTHTSYLTMSFRFGDVIADAANKILRTLGETKPLRGNPSQTSHLGTFHYDVSLSRTNAMLVSELIRQLSAGKRVYVVGGINDLKRLLQGVKMLQANQSTDVPEFFGYSNWHEVLTEVRADEGHELSTFVNLVERFSVDRLSQALDKTHRTESSADTVLSTVHKAKGRQWNRVYLTDDFLTATKKSQRSEKPSIAPEEFRIAYVALTRAKKAVYIPPGIRTAVGIRQDPKYDFDQSSDATREDPAKKEGGPSSNFNPAPQPNGNYEKDNQSRGWLAKIRDMFR